MSPEQIARVRTTVFLLDGRESDLAAAFTAELVVHAPTAQRLLPDPARAGDAILRELQAFADVATDFDALQTWARQLGAASGAPVTASELRGIGLALVQALDTVLDAAFGPDEREAWQAGVALVTELTG